jgi:hypothetical protein
MALAAAAFLSQQTLIRAVLPESESNSERIEKEENKNAARTHPYL